MVYIQFGLPRASNRMNNQNTIYIAEPIFSEKLQGFDSDCSFPPIKKIGITTDHPERRERELLGTVSPVKISIVKAWTIFLYSCLICIAELKLLANTYVCETGHGAQAWTQRASRCPTNLVLPIPFGVQLNCYILQGICISVFVRNLLVKLYTLSV